MAGCILERARKYTFREIHRMWMFVSALVPVGAGQSLIAYSGIVSIL